LPWWWSESGGWWFLKVCIVKGTVSNLAVAKSESDYIQGNTIFLTS
jgi:hypothetical protein